MRIIGAGRLLLMTHSWKLLENCTVMLISICMLKDLNLSLLH